MNPDDLHADLATARDSLSRLLRTKDPVARNALAVELMATLPGLLRDARVRAAKDAVADGLSATEYARRIGVSPKAVDHLLHRAGTRARARTAEDGAGAG